MKAEFIITANSSSVDMNTNQLSIFDLIDEIEVTTDQVKGPVVVPVVFQLIASIMRDESDPVGRFDPTLRIILHQPNEERKEQLIPIKYEPQHVRNRIRISMTLNVSIGGTYTIEVQTEERKSLGSKSIVVRMIQPS